MPSVITILTTQR